MRGRGGDGGGGGSGGKGGNVRPREGHGGVEGAGTENVYSTKQRNGIEKDDSKRDGK